jgi:RimJ/RimL family protein N-acetyltransferase
MVPRWAESGGLVGRGRRGPGWGGLVGQVEDASVVAAMSGGWVTVTGVDNSATTVRLEAWTEADLAILRAANTPEMMAHLGGQETEDQLLERHRKYLRLTDPAAGQMLAVVLPDGVRAGVIGYWERSWQGGQVYETGWHVLAGFQGRGVASAAARAVARLARAQRRQRQLHAFPGNDHPASNAVCRNAGFTLLGETDFEYPPGAMMRCNDWRLEL